MPGAIATQVLFVLWLALSLHTPTAALNVSSPIYYPDHGQIKAWGALWKPILYSGLLELQTLRNFSSPLHIIFSGDSTLRQQRDFLCFVIDETHLPEGKDVWDVMNPSKLKHLSTPQSCWSEKLQIRITYHSNSCCGPVELPKFNETEPGWNPNTTTSVFYYNCGLHLLHLGAARPFECLNSYVNLEERLTALTASAHQAMGEATDLYVYMTTNWICTDKFTGAYRIAAKSWRKNRAGVVSSCMKTLKAKKGASSNVTEEQSKEACSNAFFSDDGVQNLNRRALSVIHRLSASSSHGRFAVVDAYQMTRNSCWATHSADGRHYLPIIPLQLSELVKTVQRHNVGRHRNNHKSSL